MALKVYKVADIVNNVIVFGNMTRFKPGDVAKILTNVKPIKAPNSSFQWQIELEIGTGKSMKLIPLDLHPMISEDDNLDFPLFIEGGKIIFFKDRLFMPERIARTIQEKEEVVLRVKKAIYDEEVDLSNLKAAVANLEAAIEYRKSKAKRMSIPEDVKLVVWARDGGACSHCGSKMNLQFDHIIPLSKGGSNSEANIQILCQLCNLKKTDNIAST